MNMRNFFAWVQAQNQPGSINKMNIDYQNRNQTEIKNQTNETNPPTDNQDTRQEDTTSE